MEQEETEIVQDLGRTARLILGSRMQAAEQAQRRSHPEGQELLAQEQRAMPLRVATSKRLMPLWQVHGARIRQPKPAWSLKRIEYKSSITSRIPPDDRLDSLSAHGVSDVVGFGVNDLLTSCVREVPSSCVNDAVSATANKEVSVHITVVLSRPAENQ